MAAYNYLNQYIVASALIENTGHDSFYDPANQGHNGFAADGNYYVDGVLQVAHAPASWFSEPIDASYRGFSSEFPASGIILLSKSALTILDEATLKLWMQFLLADSYALTNNFNGQLNGWTPSRLTYANGVVAVIYVPDPGNEDSLSSDFTGTNSKLVLNIDFAQDKVYVDISTLGTNTGGGTTV